MKATLLFAALSAVFALPCESAQTELESLRLRCKQQEERIRQLESQMNPQGTKAVSDPKASQSTPAKPKTPIATAASNTYRVKAGDTIERIARRNHCTTASINKINGLKSSSIIHPGQKLKLPATSATSMAAAKSTPAPAKQSSITRTHQISEGDTYSSISRKYGIPVKTLIAANPRIKPTSLRPGTTILLGKQETAKTVDPTRLAATPQKAPSGTQKAAIQASAQPSAPPSKSPSLKSQTTTPVLSNQGTDNSRSYPEATETVEATPPEAPAAASTAQRKSYSVKTEQPMTYGQFASQHGTSPERLNDLNGLDLTQATVLAKGSELYVPAQP